jgi:hypothetical protein
MSSGGSAPDTPPGDGAPPVRIALCCNDGDDGVFAGKFDGINIHGLVDLELQRGEEPAFSFWHGCARISGREYFAVASKRWFGNWCWNAYWFPIETAYRLLCQLHRTGKFAATMSQDPLLDWWDAEQLDFEAFRSAIEASA